MLQGPASPQSLSRPQVSKAPELPLEATDVALPELVGALELDRALALVPVVAPPLPPPPEVPVGTLLLLPLSRNSIRARPPQATTTEAHPIKTIRIGAASRGPSTESIENIH